MKRAIYIAAFTLFGIQLSFLLHAAIEIPILKLLTKDFRHYSLGLTWNQWYALHHVIGTALFLGGTILGFWQGKYWWRIIYIEKRRWRK